MKVAVTGGSGAVGGFVLKELIDHGHEVVSIDRTPSNKVKCHSIIVDLTDLGEVYGALHGVDAVIHLAGINSPGGVPNEVVYQNNTMSTYNIFEAAAGLRIRKVAVASSESIYGFCWAKEAFSPNFFPVNESHPVYPKECYGLSKQVTENIAEMFHRREGMQAVCLRLASVVSPEKYVDFMEKYDVQKYRFLFSYIDSRDAASACRLAVERDGLGFASMNITADDTCSEIPTKELIEQYFPDVHDIRTNFKKYDALSSNAEAKSLLDWRPRFSWREMYNKSAE